MSLRDRTCVTGFGETAYLRGSTKPPSELQLEASLRAIADAGLSPMEIDGIIPLGTVSGTAEGFIENFGIPDLRFSSLSPRGRASLGMALPCAAVNKSGASIHGMPQFHYVIEFDYPLCAIAPVRLYAPMPRRHMELNGTTVEHFGEVAVTRREHALFNDNAVMKKPVALAGHRAARTIAGPFVQDCRPRPGRRCHNRSAVRLLRHGRQRSGHSATCISQ